MRSATRVLLGALAVVLVAGSARAQNAVTFQVDMNPYIATCQFNPATSGVTVPGSMNGWNTAEFPLTNNGSGVFTGTHDVAEGEINYKFYVTNSAILSWENDPNRTYTVVAGAQTIPVVTFNGPTPEDNCAATEQDYAVTFAVDMSVQIGRGGFNPATQQVAVAGSFTDWGGNPFVLSEDSGTAGLYAGTINLDNLPAPGTQQFKFIIRNTATGEITSWERVDPVATPDNSGGGDPNRILRLTGNEPDTDGDGRLEVFYDNNDNPEDFPFYSDADASQFITAPATLTLTVDARSAQYYLAANPGLGLPNGGATAINGVAINGPAMGESQQDGGPAGGIGDWAGWGDVLGAIPERQLTNTGNNVWTITLNYAAGARRTLVAKFGVNGDDNESGFGGDHILPITEGANSYTLAFGCIRQADGTFLDETGGTPPTFAFYDEYLLIRNDLTPPTCVTVTSGGVAGDVMTVANEGGPQIAGLAIGAAYPNPVAGRASLDLTLDRAMNVVVRLFDVTGREVATLAEGSYTAGRTPLTVDARSLAPGVYVLRVEADGQAVSRRLTVVR